MKKYAALACILCLCLISFSAAAAATTYTGTTAPIVINAPGAHTITLNGVTIDATVSAAISVEAPATRLTVILKDGSENHLTGGSNYAGIANNGVDLIIRCEHAGTGHECNDTCGKLYVEGGLRAAGIGGCGDSSERSVCLEGNITIAGGNIDVVGGGAAAGIGGGCYFGDFLGTLTISGGNISIVSGGNSAGIGGGYEGYMSGTVRITGGYVKADGGKDLPSTGGAGIGGGIHLPLSGTVEITGGVVEAIGGRNAPGIGGGDAGDMSGTVLISGGTVTAIGSENAPAIGAGAGGERTESAVIAVSPANYDIKVLTGSSEQTAAETEGSPFAAYTNLTALLNSMQYAKFTTLIPAPTVTPAPTPTPTAPAVPDTGDATDPAQLALLAMLGLTGIILLRRRRAA